MSRPVLKSEFDCFKHIYLTTNEKGASIFRIIAASIYETVSDQARQFFWIYILLVITIHIVPISDHVAPNEYYYISMRPDQIIHFFIYSPFCFLIWAWQKVNFYEDTFYCLAILLIGLIFSFVLETLHLFIPYRSFELGDLVANMLGALAGSIAFLIRSE